MRFERIVITGVPGTGKTTLSDEVGGKLGLEVTHVDSGFLRSHDLVEGTSRGGEDTVDLKELQKTLFEVKGVLESHLLCEFELPKSTVIVLRCDPEILRERLEGRGYSEKKVRENLECEALDYCTQLAESNYDNVYELDTSERRVEESAEECVRILDGLSSGDAEIDYSNYLMK